MEAQRRRAKLKPAEVCATKVKRAAHEVHALVAFDTPPRLKASAPAEAECTHKHEELHYHGMKLCSSIRKNEVICPQMKGTTKRGMKFPGPS